MKRLPLPALALLSLAACSNSSNGGHSDGGDGGLPDICNTAASAMGDTQCELTVLTSTPGDAGFAGQQYFIDHVGKQLWLWIQLPATLPPGTLFNLEAGYSVPSTPVDLAINLLEANLTSSLGLQVDNHSSGKPHVLDFTFALDPTLTPPGSIVWVEATDSSNAHDDVHNPFNIYVDLVQDPDKNVGVTPIVLGSAGTGGAQVGTCANGDGGQCEGVLSVEGREDTFSVAVPTSVTRPILYVDLTAPTLNLSPPPLYDLAYDIKNAAGTVINSGSVPNQYTQANLSTALLVDPGQTYTIDVFGLNPNVTPPSVPGPGDIRITYALNVEVLPDLDTNEPNDTLGETLSHPVTFSGPGDSQTITGRLSYIGDADWFNLSFPATSAPTRLHYKFTPGTAGSGRYSPVGVPLPGPDRLANLTLGISGMTACLQDSTQCPRDPTYIDSPSSQQQLFDALCANGDGDGGSLCLLSGRNEIQATDEGFAPLQNFEGIVPLQGNGAQSLFLDFQSSSGNYCDDIPYTLLLDWETMPGQQPSSMASPIMASLQPFNESGVLAAGYGNLVKYNLTEQPPVDVRAQQDYDAIPSNVDTYEVGIPSAYANAPLGASWGLTWTLTDASGMPAESLLLGVTFCTSDGTCTSGTPPDGPVDGAIYYNSIDYQPWWDPHAQGWYTNDEFAVLWNTTAVSGGQTVTASPFSCTCFQPNYLAGGKFYVTVQGADRTAWTDTAYTLGMTIGSYPSSFTLDGGTYACPVSYPDPILSVVIDGGTYADGGTYTVSVDAGTPVGCEFTHGFNGLNN